MITSSKNSTDETDKKNTKEENEMLLVIISREMNKLSKTQKLKCYKQVIF
jgi:hypothetical protein